MTSHVNIKVNIPPCHPSVDHNKTGVTSSVYLHVNRQRASYMISIYFDFFFSEVYNI